MKTPLSGYTPQGFWTAYDAASAPTGSTTNAAVIAEGDVSGVVTDLRTAEAAYGLPQVPVNVVAAGLPSSDTSGADEWDLDSQYVTGMAGDVASLTFYTATSMTDQDIALAFNRWESDDTAQVANASFGICETFAYLDGSMALDDEVLNLAAAHGQTLFASTGDTGSSCGFVLPTNGVPLTGLPEVEYPAASPYAVGVGGTRLVTGSDDTYSTETAWEAGGGGISQHEASPPWQANTVVSNTRLQLQGPARHRDGRGARHRRARLRRRPAGADRRHEPLVAARAQAPGRGSRARTGTRSGSPRRSSTASTSA